MYRISTLGLFVPNSRCIPDALAAFLSLILDEKQYGICLFVPNSRCGILYSIAFLSLILDDKLNDDRLFVPNSRWVP